MNLRQNHNALLCFQVINGNGDATITYGRQVALGNGNEEFPADTNADGSNQEQSAPSHKARGISDQLRTDNDENTN